MAKETKGGTWMDANGNDSKGHVNIYDKNPRGQHDDSTHININYGNESFQITEKSNGEKSTTDCKCYLTSACMKHFNENFDDNCHELTVLRRFRDNYVSKEDIEHYYKTAPIIVESINNVPNNEIIYNYIYNQIVSLCVNEIENGNYDSAYNRYKNSILSLEEIFAKPLLRNKLVKTLKKVKN